MANTIDGKKLSKEIELRIKHEIILGLEKAERPPGLAVVCVGDDPASRVYVANKAKACARVGVESFKFHFNETSTTQEIIQKIKALNEDINVDGILVQLPLPQGINEAEILKTIVPTKDADGLHAYNLGCLIKGEPGPRSCTPAGIMALLGANGIDLKGKKVVVVGRSILVGKPMALMLQAANATVTVAHSFTKNLEELTRQAEILIVAAGKPGLIGKEHLMENSVVIDVGIHRILKESPNINGSLYSLCGDVRYEEAISKVSAITPVPGGVGPMTVSMLLVNTVSRWQEHCGLSLTLRDLLP